MEHTSVYADATALIGLARINRLDLLSLFPIPIVVTARVWDEVAEDPEKPGVRALHEARAAGLLTVVAAGDPGAFPQLDPGESTVLSAAAAARASVLLDERRARAVVRRDPELRRAITHVTGIIGLILLAKDRGRIAVVRPLLDELLRQGFHLSPALVREVVERAGEP